MKVAKVDSTVSIRGQIDRKSVYCQIAYKDDM